MNHMTSSHLKKKTAIILSVWVTFFLHTSGANGTTIPKSKFLLGVLRDSPTYSAKEPRNKSSNFFPTKYAIPKSLKVSHWLKELAFTTVWGDKINPMEFENSGSKKSTKNPPTTPRGTARAKEGTNAMASDWAGLYRESFRLRRFGSTFSNSKRQRIPTIGTTIFPSSIGLFITHIFLGLKPSLFYGVGFQRQSLVVVFPIQLERNAQSSIRFHLPHVWGWK